MTRVLVVVAIVLANFAACSKKSDAPANPPADDPKTQPAPAAPDVAAGAAVGGSGGSGSAAGSNVAGSGSATGSSAAGSDAGSGSAAAAGAGSANAGYNRAAFLEDPLCVQVADMIRTCVDKAEFVKALDDGATAEQKKTNARLRKGVKKWQKSHELCRNAWDIMTYEYMGFLDNPAPFKAPDALSSCATLGTAVKAGGGLVGGDTAE